MEYIDFEYYINNLYNSNSLFSDPLIQGLLYGATLGIKSCIMVFVFIWARASFPRIRFDQLMSFCWTILLPIVIAFVILVPCILYSFEIIPSNIILL
jgi:NADH-ubiquinone oxidoreductase chain 1